MHLVTEDTLNEMYVQCELNLEPQHSHATTQPNANKHQVVMMRSDQSLAGKFAWNAGDLTVVLIRHTDKVAF